MATSCATRVTRAIGAGTRDAFFRLPPVFALAERDPERDPELDLLVAALRVELVPELRFVDVELPLRPDAERPADAERVADVPAAAADRPRDLLRPTFFLVLLRDELLPRDFPRDFLALVAIDASPRSH